MFLFWVAPPRQDRDRVPPPLADGAPPRCAAALTGPYMCTRTWTPAGWRPPGTQRSGDGRAGRGRTAWCLAPLGTRPQGQGGRALRSFTALILIRVVRFEFVFFRLGDAGVFFPKIILFGASYLKRWLVIGTDGFEKYMLDLYHFGC